MLFSLALAILIASTTITAIVTPIILRRNAAAGRVDTPGGRKRQVDAVPYGGGLAALVGFAVPVGGGLALAALHEAGILELPEVMAAHASGVVSKGLPIAAILGGSILLLLMGRVDDKRPLPAGFRFVVQVLTAGAVVLAGVRVTIFVDVPAVHVIATIAWIVFVTNAVNFIDNMDGLLAGGGLATAAGLFAVAAADGQLFVAAFAVALTGCLLAVLWYNRPPARIYLGDEGSMFLGFLFATLVVVTSFQSERGPGAFTPRPFLVPILLLVVPVIDATVAVVSRLRRGVAPWTAGRDHLSHRLVSSGFPPRSAVLVLVGIAFAGAAVAQLAYGFDSTRIAFAAAFAAIMTTCLMLGIREKRAG